MKTELRNDVLLSIYKSIKANIKRLEAEKKLVVKELRTRNIEFE